MTTSQALASITAMSVLSAHEMRTMLRQLDKLIPDTTIQGLNLEPLLVKLRVEHGWSQKDLLAHYLFYKQFLYLCKTTTKPIVPTKMVDKFWHAHLEDNEKYEKDCFKIFGKTLYHFPYFGLRSKTDRKNLQRAGKSTRKLISSTFGITGWGSDMADFSLCGPSSGCEGHEEQCSNKRSARRPKLEVIEWN
jgi:hypothetical protein